MATTQKRKAAEQLTPNLVAVTQRANVVGSVLGQQLPRRSPTMDASRVARCAWHWLTKILEITPFYTTHYNQNDTVTETHVQSTTARNGGAIAIKRRRTKRSKTAAKKNESEFVTVSTDPYRKGGMGEPDFSGCTTEEEKAKRLELFWEPPELIRKRRCDIEQSDEHNLEARHASNEEEGRRSEDENGSDEDVIMMDSEEEDSFDEEEPVTRFDGGTDSTHERLSSNSLQKPDKVDLQTQQNGDTPKGSLANSRPSSSPVKSATGLMGGRGRSTSSTWSAHTLSTKSESPLNAVPQRQVPIEEQVKALLIDVSELEAGKKEHVKKEIEDGSKHGLGLESRKVVIQHPDEGTIVPREVAYDKSKPLKSILKGSKYYSNNESKQGRLHLVPSKDKLAQREELFRRREKEEKAARAKAKKEARLHRRHPDKPLIKVLDTKWDTLVRSACSNPSTITTTLPGQPLTSKDFGTLLRTREWLNDEIINGYVEWVVDAANNAANAEAMTSGEKPGIIPKFIAHNSFFYNILDDPKKGAKTTARLMKRKGAPGISLMDVDTVFVPICKSMHWTLGVVRPFAKTVEYFDSMGGRPSRFFHLMREWLAFQLGEAYVPSEWSESYTKCAHQSNGYDCGVFLCTNAFCVAAGLDPLCYDERNLAQQRKNIAAILINRGFVGDFQWTDDL
ncbi:hypothetical protein BP6252_06248 [Coleophoma cylindrospora]|uniref:Ubiquitin-like protease family profile domain-containing protein n=1 Tax=Coleophoma cylindrospora TaxID=1849047 RepID=A0A3D8RME0_9HELO|nr:hypothetical protein BP6252_06248 [Coleophoma cylindrospora]